VQKVVEIYYFGSIMYGEAMMRVKNAVIRRAKESTKGMIKSYLSRWNKLGIIFAHFGWDEEDFLQEFMIHLISHNKGSTQNWRDKWNAEGIDWEDIGTQKSFRAWTKREMKSFVGRLYYREILRSKNSDEIIAGDDWSEEIELEVDEMNKVESKSSLSIICKWIEEEATEREKFIFNYNLELVEAVWDDGRISNYPEGSVSKKTFYSHRDALAKKLKLIIGEV
jgi:hypothetical protein